MKWRNGRPNAWYGYTDMGPIQMPQVPRYIRLTDRDDGTLWWLSYSTSPATGDGYGYVTLTDTAPPASQESITFGPYDGPYLGSDLGSSGQLMVRGGYLGVERQVIRALEDSESQQIYARKSGLNIPMRHIILSTTVSPDSVGAWYAWVPYTFTQTPNPS